MEVLIRKVHSFENRYTMAYKTSGQSITKPACDSSKDQIKS